MKKVVIILWVVFVVCVIAAVGLWFAMNNVEIEYEEVKATVVSAETTQVVNKKTGSKTNFYEVKVRYDGEVQELKNVHDTYTYKEGSSVTAYLSNGKLYANIEGIKTATPVAIVYYIFLFGSFIMLFVAATVSSKASQKKKAEQQ